MKRICCPTAIIFLLFLLCFSAQVEARVQATPSITLSEEYTDNLFLTDGDEESDFITVVSPGLALDFLGKRSELSLFYSPGFSFYQEYDELNSVRHRASLEGTRGLSRRLTLSLSSAFEKTEEPYTRAELPLTPEVVAVEDFADYALSTQREPRYITDSLVRMDYDFGRRDTMFAEYNHLLYLDDNEGGEDTQRHNPGVGFEVWPSFRNGFSGEAYYTRALFEGDEGQFSSLDGNLRYIRSLNRDWDAYVEYSHLYTYFDEATRVDYQVYNPATGVIYYFAEDASIEVGGGYYILDRENGTRDTGATVNLAMEKAWEFRGGAFRVTGGSGYEQTYYRAATLGFTEYHEAGAALEYSLTRYLLSDLGASYRYNKYLEEDREDHIASATAGLSYPLTRWLDISLRDTFRVVETDSELDATDYRENSVMLTLTATANPIRLSR